MDSKGRDISINYQSPRSRNDQRRAYFILAVAGTTSGLIGAMMIVILALFSHPHFHVSELAQALVFGILLASPLCALIFGIASLVGCKVEGISFRRNPFAFISVLFGAILIVFEILYILNH